MQENNDELIESGHVSGAHGIRGWVKIYSNTHPREKILELSPWLLSSGDKLESIEVKGKKQGKLIIAKLENCDDRNQAELLLGKKIYIKKSQLPTLKEGDFYWTDLEGLSVVSLSGETLGVVDHLIETGANDVLVVKGEKERLIPFVLGEIVQSVDLKKGLITTDWQTDY